MAAVGVQWARLHAARCPSQRYSPLSTQPMTETLITPAIARYLDHTRIPLRLACDTQSGWPFVLSLWYLHEAGNLCCATVNTAKVVDYLRREPRCAFEVAADEPPYCGVRGQALAEIDQQRGEEILRRLLQRYLGGADSALARRLLARSEQEVAIVLQPVNVFTWNYSNRMQDVAGERKKPCPGEP